MTSLWSCLQLEEHSKYLLPTKQFASSRSLDLIATNYSLPRHKQKLCKRIELKPRVQCQNMSLLPKFQLEYLLYIHDTL